MSYSTSSLKSRFDASVSAVTSGGVTSAAGFAASPAIVIGPIAKPGGGFAGYDLSTGKTVKTAFATFDVNGVADPVTADQWHLTRLGDLNAVWKDYTGKDVHVGVYDSGIQYAHWDLAANYDASREVVIDGEKVDGKYVPDSGAHGTSVAGLIAAARNGEGGVGVSYDAKVTSVNIFDPNSKIFVNGDNADAFFESVRQSANFDVTNHSWGGRTPVMTEASRLTEGSFGYEMVAALSNGSVNGRGGLGTVHVAAAGNDTFDGQLDSWKTDRHVVTVGSYRESDGNSSYYTSSGAHLLVSAPSNDFAVIGGTGQVTTDLLGTDGYNTAADPRGASDYTDQFGGTSGATPVVSGVVSLMLDANENLGWRDVRDILAYSAKLPVAFDTGQTAVAYQGDYVILNESKFQMAGQDANWNGGAAHYSRDYGYGAVDAYNAVRMAEVWNLFGASKTSANEVSMTTGTLDVGLTLNPQPKNTYQTIFSDFVGTPQSFTFNVTDAIDVEHLDLTVNFDYSFKTDDGEVVPLSMLGTKLKLIAPDGTSGFIDTYLNLGQVFAGTIAYPKPGPQEFTFGLEGFRGVDTVGTWTAQFEQTDYFNINGVMNINSIKLDAYGSEASNDDVYTYTNEFFTMAAIAGETGRKTLVDTDGGTDWINAAAVSSDIKLSLVAGQSTSFGGEKAFTLGRTSNIEGAVTGDGNDTLIGSRFDNYLFGMRGDDTLNGGAGNDYLFGGTGRDKFLFDNKGTSGKDTVLDWSGGDMIATQTALRGAGADGKVTVAKNAMLLLDGLLTGDTVTLSQNGGAVLQAQGQKNGYFWYSYVSGADLDPNDVIHEVSYQPERVAAGEVQAIASTASSSAASSADAGVAFVDGAAGHDAFYLYDPMAGSMSAGVLLHA